MLNREEIFSYVKETYRVEPDYPWGAYPAHAALRHQDSGKWFALILKITEDKLGLNGRRPIDIVNLKCDPFLIGSLRCEPGVFPAYHMNKEHWLTIALDSPFQREEIFRLIDLSYDLTAKG